MVGGVESGKTWNGPILTAIAAKNAIAAKKVLLFAFFPMLTCRQFLIIICYRAEWVTQ
jgi:hypothetical protein